MKEKGLLLVICGPSGVGKGTICKELLKKRQDLKLSISATTRPKREGEVDGINYFFISEEQFKNMIEKDEFLEYAQVYGNYYGTPKDFVINALREGKDLILEIDTQGARQIKEKFPEGIFIFILPPSMKELKKRIVGRGTETIDIIEKRLKSAYNEISLIKDYDYYVINDDIESATNKIISIIEAEKCRVNDEIINYIESLKEEV